jgi:hypothetical protein
MSEQPEPTLADVLAAIEASRAEAGHRFDRIDAAIGQLRADVAAVKVDTGFLEAHSGDQHEAIRRHFVDPDAHRRAA